nr:MAG TPA: hypothetical protein [Caudoviricetes sp.]
MLGLKSHVKSAIHPRAFLPLRKSLSLAFVIIS